MFPYVIGFYILIYIHVVDLLILEGGTIGTESYGSMHNIHLEGNRAVSHHVAVYEPGTTGPYGQSLLHLDPLHLGTQPG